MLKFTDVSFRYSNQTLAVKSVSFDIAAGEFIAVAGRNGSGKTTLTKLMMALLKPCSGTITFHGQDTKKYSPADMARSVGYVFQNPDRQMFRDTVAMEVAYGPQQLGFPAEQLQQAVASALAVTGLEEFSNAYPRTLTKGQRQRVAIASALAMEPEILILDEPTSGQDSHSSHDLMELLTGLNAAGRTIILVTHNMDLLAQYAKRAIIMDQGVKAFDGSVSELFGQSRNIAAWGLREPAATLVSRSLTQYGVAVTSSAGALAQDVFRVMGGAKHA